MKRSGWISLIALAIAYVVLLITVLTYRDQNNILHTQIQTLRDRVAVADLANAITAEQEHSGGLPTAFWLNRDPDDGRAQPWFSLYQQLWPDVKVAAVNTPSQNTTEAYTGIGFTIFESHDPDGTLHLEYCVDP